MEQETVKSLRVLITEITLRATTKICEGFTPARIEAIAVPLADALVDIVISQGNASIQGYKITLSHYTTFEIWNQILDEVQKEIPCVSHMDVIGNNLTRSQRARYLTGEWRTLPEEK